MGAKSFIVEWHDEVIQLGKFPSQIILGKDVVLGLNVGCGLGGTCFREPYVNLDVDRERHVESWKKKGKQPPITFIIGDGINLPFKDEVFDEVYASHVLEHFNWAFTVPILKEWKRVLVDGGVIKVCVPDFAYAVKLYTNEIKPDKWTLGNPSFSDHTKVHGYMGDIYQLIYGWFSKVDSQKIGHKMCFDHDLLEYALELAGFKNVRCGEIHSVPYREIKAEIVMVANK